MVPTIPDDKLREHVAHYKSEITAQLRNAVAETGKSVRLGDVENVYSVTYSGNLGAQMKIRDDPESISYKSLQDYSRAISLSTG